MATYQELNNKYKETFNCELPRATLARWIKEGKVKAEKQQNGKNNYDFNSFLITINNPDSQKHIKAKKSDPNNYIGKVSGKLLIKGIVPKELRNDKKYNGTIMYCDCLLCGSKNNQIRFSYLTGNGNFQQRSCGCDRKRKAFKTTSRQDLSESFLDQFADFERYLLIHKMFQRTTNIDIINIPLEQYENIIKYFYYDKQFNAVYDFWEDHKNEIETFYDWAKPSLDHIQPKSKGGTDELNNLQILTVFENLSKRDMSMSEWDEFKQKTHTTSDYFIENILK